MGGPKILIVIPTYNNARTLRDVAEKSLSTGYAVLVVNDGSTDGTPDAVKGLNIPLLSFPANRGKGAAIRRGAAWARENGYSHMITLDADGQHDPAEVPLFAKRITEHPMAVILGKRDFESGNAPPVSSFGRKFSNFWVRFTSGLEVSDSQSGYRAYPVMVVDSIGCFSRRYNYEVEILVRCRNAGVAIESVDIKAFYSQETKKGSHFRPFVDNARISVTFTALVARNCLSVPCRCYGRDGKTGGIGRISMAGLLKGMRWSEAFFSGFLGGLWGTLPFIVFHKFLLSFMMPRFRVTRPAFPAVTGNFILLCGLPFIPLISFFTGHLALNAANLFPMVRSFWDAIPEYFCGAVILSPLAGLFFALAACLLKALAGPGKEKADG
jgi:glycosyltransferase involved in cell wall biosynthesis